MARAALRPVAHDDRLSLVEHLDELRTRLIICVVGLVVCFGFTFWQADNILELVNKPLEQTQNLDGTTWKTTTYNDAVSPWATGNGLLHETRDQGAAMRAISPPTR